MKKLISTLLFISFVSLVWAQDLRVGKDYYYYSRYASAEYFFHTYLRQQPQSGEAWLWLMQSYLKQNKDSVAYDSVLQANISMREDPYYLVALGDGYLAVHKKDSAFLLFNKAIELTKGRNPELLAAIAEAQLISDDGDVNFALAVLQNAIKKDKKNSSLHVTMGNIYRKMHNGSEAYRSYVLALEKNKSYAPAYYQLGDLFLSQKNTVMYLDYFNKAVEADSQYAPAWHALYMHYIYTDPARAMDYFKKYDLNSDNTSAKQYAYTDLLYLSKHYEAAISSANAILSREGENAQPRLYKLMAYSFSELKDTLHATSNMQQYFRTELDSNLIAKDFETMARFFLSDDRTKDSVEKYYRGAARLTTDTEMLQVYFKELASLANEKKDYVTESLWLGKYYEAKERPNNVDLFRWGLAAFRAGNYSTADSVFGLYTERYPEQGFGYYWRARSNAAIDTTLSEGLAIPHYEKLIATISDDTLTSTNKKWLVEAYSYLASYETNTEKDYKEAIGYFDKILEIDPENDAARKYVEILEQNLKQADMAN